jgi:hypothetical protein
VKQGKKSCHPENQVRKDSFPIKKSATKEKIDKNHEKAGYPNEPERLFFAEKVHAQDIVKVEN